MLYKIDTQQKFDPDLVHLEVIIPNIRCGSIADYDYVYICFSIHKVREKDE